MKNEPQYLGDGVYAQQWAMIPGGVILSTGSHILEEAENVVYLEPEVIDALQKFLV